MSKISLIISREYSQRVRKRTFILTTILTPLLMVAIVFVPVMLSTMGSLSVREIVVVDQSHAVAGGLTDGRSVHYRLSADSTYADAVADKTNDEAYGFLVIGSDIVENPQSLALYTRKSSTLEIEKNITDQVSGIVENLRVNNYNIAALDSIMQSIRADASVTTFEISDTNQDQLQQTSSGISMGISYIGGFIIYMFVFMYGSMVLQGVVEEKSNRIIEVMVSSVRPMELMMGKILGISLVALTQVGIWILLIGGMLMVGGGLLGGEALSDLSASAASASTLNSGSIGVSMGGMDASSIAGSMDPELMAALAPLFNPWYIITLLGCFLIYFAGGYLLYAAMFAAIGSAVDNVADTQQLQLPVTIPLILALIVMMNVMNDPHSGIAFWFSIIPFTSPIIMMARIPYGVPAWEIILSVTLLYATFIGMTYFAAKIYRVGIFMYGKKPSLKELIKWSRYR